MVVLGGIGDTVITECTHWVAVGIAEVFVEVLPGTANVDFERVELLRASGEGAMGKATVEVEIVMTGMVVLSAVEGGGSDGEDKGVVEGSFVAVTAIVFVDTDSDSSTTFVDTTISVKVARVLGRAVTVVVSFVVCVTVWISSVIVADDRAAEPPSTATTE